MLPDVSATQNGRRGTVGKRLRAGIMDSPDQIDTGNSSTLA